MRTIRVQSTCQQELIDITAQVVKVAQEWTVGAILIYVPHTTAGVLVNEHADPDVARDIVVALDEMVPADGIYRHREDNSAAHVKAAMVGTSQVVPIDNGGLALGTWQGIFLAEFDGPRVRTVNVTPLAGDGS